MRSPPNIVFILADDLGFADPGFNGGREIKTPNLDRLARGGAIFDSFYVQPLCSPTRAALMTGRYPIRYGLQVGVIRPTFHYGLPLRERTLAQALKEAGYHTAICGKWHLGSFDRKYWPNARGFDHAYGHLFGMIDYFTHMRNGQVDWYRNGVRLKEPGYTTELIAREAVEYIRRHAGKHPFFLYVPFNAVHAPHQVTEKYLKPYGHLKGKRRLLAGMLAAMDEAVGRIAAAVEETGIKKRTLFVFSSDNGGPRPGVVTDNGPLRGGKGTLYEGGVRVCAFAAWPGRIPAGVHVSGPLHIVDWYPTLIRLAGGKITPPVQKVPLDGKDIWPTITEGKPSPHEELLLNATPTGGAIRVGEWKLKVTVRAGRVVRLELFDLKNDIGEKKNLAQENPKKARELLTRYLKFAEEAAPPKALSERRGKKRRRKK